MRFSIHGLARLIFLQAVLFGGFLYGSQISFSAETRCAVLEVYLSGSARSQAVRKFVEKTYSKRPGLIVVMRDVQSNDAYLDRYWKLMDHYKVQKPTLPAFYVSGQLELGWDAVALPARLADALSVEVFVRDGCKRCQAAHPVLFERLAARYPGYNFIERDLGKSEAAFRRLQELSQRYRVQATSVPAVHLCGRLMVGFIDAESSFRQWDEVLEPVTVICPANAAPPVRRPENRKQSAGSTSPSNWFSSTALAAEPVSKAIDKPLSEPPQAVVESEGVGHGDEVTEELPPPRRQLGAETPTDTDLIEMPPLSQPTENDNVTLPFLGEVRWRQWGLPVFTVAVGLVDGFNPCAMWVLLFLLSLLVNVKDRWKILAVAGTFVLISGLVYFAFMAAWLNVFQLIGLLRPAQVILGLIALGIGTIHIKDFFAYKKGVSLSIPESVKPGLYDRMRRIVTARTLGSAILGASMLAVLVNVVELLCTAGLPAMYTGILTLQNFPPWKNYAYLLLYNIAYMFDDALMVTLVVVTLGRHKLQEQGGRILKLISGIVILVLGIVMLLRPDWLI